MSEHLSKPHKIIALASLLLFVLLGAITGHQMRPWVDEAWYGVPAMTLVNHGYFGSPCLDGTIMGLKDIGQYSYWVMPMLPLSQAAWELVFPQTLHSIRMVSTLCGAVGILFWAIFLQRLTRDAITTVIFLLLASCDYVLTSAAGFGRPDMLAFTFQGCAFGLYMLFRERRFGLAILLSETCVVLSGMTHPNGGILSFLGVLCLALYLDRSRIRVAHVLIASVPFLVAATGWGLYILKNPAAFFAQYGYQTAGRFTGFAHPWSAMSREVTQRYMPQMGLGASFHPFKAVAFASAFAAIVAILSNPDLRNRRAPRLMMGIVAIYLVFYVFLEQTKEDYYFSYLSTFYTGLLAFYLAWLWQQHRTLRPLVMVAIAGIMAVQAAGPILKLRQNPWADYEASAQWITDHAKPSDKINGSYELGFFLGYTPRFLDDPNLGILNGRTPDFVLMDPIYDGRMVEEKRRDPATYRALMDLFTHYREVYRRADYRILMHDTHAPVI